MRNRSAWIELLGAINACRTEQVSFEIGFESGVGVNRSKMRREINVRDLVLNDWLIDCCTAHQHKEALCANKY